MDHFRQWLKEQGKAPEFCTEYDRLYAEYEASGKEALSDQPLEESFSRLDKMLEKLEDRSLPLEEALRLYQQGMELLAQCSGKIDTVEKQILVLNEEGELDEF